MTYESSVIALIAVSVVFAVAIFLNLSSDWEVARDLARATDRWTAPLVIRRYHSDAKARRRLWAESGLLRRHGYAAELHRGLRGVGEVAQDVREVLAGLQAGEEILVAYVRT